MVTPLQSWEVSTVQQKSYFLAAEEDIVVRKATWACHWSVVASDSEKV